MNPSVTLRVIHPTAERPEDLDVLDADERARADRLGAGDPRRAFITGRAALRRILGERLDRDPRSLRFTAGPHGKPDLDPPECLKFNLSHSGRMIAIALLADVEIGVDIEELGRDTPTLRLARRFFSPTESDAVERAGDPDRNRVFFHCWTAKEAVLKATGSGLTVPVREVVVDPDPDAPTRVITLGGSADEAERWTLIRREAPGRWIATVAYRGPTRTMDFNVEDRCASNTWTT